MGGQEACRQLHDQAGCLLFCTATNAVCPQQEQPLAGLLLPPQLLPLLLQQTVVSGKAPVEGPLSINISDRLVVVGGPR